MNTKITHTVNITVSSLSDAHVDLEELCRTVNSAQSRFHFQTSGDAPAHAAVMTDIELYRLFALQGTLIQVSAVHLRGICKFTRLRPEELLGISVLCGALEYRAVSVNEFEDDSCLTVAPHGDCLLSYYDTPEQLTEILETLRVCDKCREFYRALSVEMEMLALDEFTEKIRSERKSRSIERWKDMGVERLPTEVRIQYRKKY